jgi:hypothetical protein
VDIPTDGEQQGEEDQTLKQKMNVLWYLIVIQLFHRLMLVANQT